MRIMPAVNLIALTLFLCGDVMTGRGIDQILPKPSDPRIYEPFVTDARDYLYLAEQAFGPIPAPVDFAYVWGDALEELQYYDPDLRLINLETAVTGSSRYWPGKGINYRMSPENIPALSAAGIDAVSLANNHVLDWGYEGLDETIETLKKAGIRTAGAGRNRTEAQSPAVAELSGTSRAIVFSFASETSGVPDDWAAEKARPGVNLLPDLSDPDVERIRDQVRQVKRTSDIVIASIHWGGNWGYDVPAEQERFARGLIDKAGVDLVHGHSSHHAKRIEMYREKLILYGCGDFLTDYEGIRGHEHYRPWLGLMYFPRIDPSAGNLLSLQMSPIRVRNFRIIRASPEEAQWLAEVLNRECRDSETKVRIDAAGRLRLEWRK